MTSTFYLKNPSDPDDLDNPKNYKESLIYFSCYFKNEGKKFVYSTGEKIKPIQWDQKNKKPVSKGKHKASNNVTVANQINRYSRAFEKIKNRCIASHEEFTSQLLKKEFDIEFKKAPKGKNVFFDAFDEFMDYKQKQQDWSLSTVKRYRNIKNILLSFEEQATYKLTFSNITDTFHADFTDYCMNTLGHINNTYSRNLGLFKTFMFWALKRGYTYNNLFIGFEKKKRVITKQIALRKVDLQRLIYHDFKNEKLERVRDVFVFACVTGMRFGELRLFSKEDIVNNAIMLKEEKDSEKESRTIPLNEMSLYLLRKYDYKLPLIANQKQNEYVKDVFREVGYTNEVVKITTKGKDNIREVMPFYDRISTHTARRTFITMMKKEGLSDKLIASITGHRDMKTLNQYYQVDDDAKTEAVKEVFNMDIPMKKVL